MSASKKTPKKATSASKTKKAAAGAAKKGAAAKKAATKSTAKKATVKKAAAKKATTSTSKTTAKKTASKKATESNNGAAKKAATKKSTAKGTTAKKAAKGAADKAAVKKAEPKTSEKKRPVKSLTATPTDPAERTIPAKYKYLHDDKWLSKQREALMRERANYTTSADRLEAEAAAMMADREPGDVQFDEESGEGDTIAVERDSSLARSAQNRQAVDDIDAALERLDNKTYGLCLAGDDIIPRERLEAIPEASVCVMHKTLMF